MADRTDIVRRIQALQERTVERGCTEAEALAAAEMASKLMAEHGLSMSDVEIQERQDCEQGDIFTGRKNAHEIQFCVPAIGRFCDCKVWKSKGSFHFFGFPEDVEMAKWLYNVIFNAMGTELARYKGNNPALDKGHSKRQSHAFLIGMASRVAQRLNEMKNAQTTDIQRTTGRDLVVVKNAVVEQGFRKTGVKLSSSGNKSYASDTSAYHSGRAAGDRVGFSRPISNGGNVRMIGVR